MRDQPEEETQVVLSKKASDLKEARETPSERPEPEAHANEGLNPQPRADYPPSGALDAEGHRPVLERSRKVR